MVNGDETREVIRSAIEVFLGYIDEYPKAFERMVFQSMCATTDRLYTHCLAARTLVMLLKHVESPDNGQG